MSAGTQCVRAAVVAALVAATLGATSAEAKRRPAEPPTLKDLASATAPITPAEPVEANADIAAQSYRDFLAIEDAEPRMRAQALRRLGDLRLAAAESLRAQDDNSAAAVGREAIDAYQRLLAEYPGEANGAEVLYQLARAWDGIGEPQRGLETLDRLVATHPGGAHYAEAQFRRGEIFFSAQRYADAERAYAAVLAHGDSDFAIQSLYKHGWSLFKQAREEESTVSFLRLLDRMLVAGGGLRRLDDLSRPERELVDDTTRALSIGFAGSEGVATLQAALNRHGQAPYEAQLHAALGDLYLEKERFQDAAEAYRAYAKRQPMDPEAPLLLVRATEAYERGGFTALVLDGKRELVAGYGPKSAFWHANRANLDPRVSAAVRANLLDLARHHHALAQRGSAEDLSAAVRWYQDFLAGFDDSPEAPATRLLLADLLFDGKRYAEAAAEYEWAAYGYAANPGAARAGYAALVAYEEAEPGMPADGRAAWRAKAVDSAIRYADTFPTEPQVPAVLTRTARSLFDGGDRARAESVAQRILALGPRAEPAQQRVAWTVLAHTWFDGARYADAERAFRELDARIPPGDPERTEVRERLAASVYRQAEARQAAGDIDGAVNEFLRVASVVPDSTIRAKAEFDAATLLLNAKQWERAARVLETFRASHPQHELAPDATRKLAVAYLEAGRTQQAAIELERVAARDGEDGEIRRTALWQAAELYAAANDRAGAARAYTAYVERFPAPFAPAIDARLALADIAKVDGDGAGRKRWLGELVAADAAAGAARTDRSRYLAAHASFELARPHDDLARAVRLTVPLDRALLAKKTATEQALAGYARAVEYGVADVTTPATWAMADLYRHLGRALLDSERPAGLAADELEAYDVLLEEQAFPFEEKAIEIHETNVGRAADGLYDEWVQKSYAALAELEPARYARTELDPEPAAAAVPDPAAPAPADAAAAAARPAPSAVNEQLALARVSLESGRTAEALPMLEAALALEPANAEGQNRLGIAYRRLGRFKDARAAYDRAIAADQSMPAPHRNLAVLLDLYLAQPAPALEQYEQYQRLDGGADPEAAAWLAELRTRMNQTQRTAEVQR
ncbi:MAG TPA: tetratricopeptide repeat protein [Steroidobacteraceae bacterium]